MTMNQPPIYSDPGKQNLETVSDAAVLYNGYIERLLRKFIAPFSAAVDFGAGRGEFALRLRRSGIDVTCLEPDPDLQRHLQNQNLPVITNIADCRGCSRIYSLNVLEHIEDDRAILKEIYATLAPGGRLLLYVPAFMQLYSDVDRAVGHYRRYTRQELVQKLHEAGFVIQTARYVDSLGFFAWWLLKYMGQKEGRLNPGAVMIYDRLCFPVSLLGDIFLSRWLGKNLLVIAERPA